MTGALLDALLPPTGLALLALVLLIARRWRSGALALALLVALSTDGVARLLFGGLMLTAAAPGPAPGAIVILPGDVPELLDASAAAPGLDTLKRLRVGAALGRQTALPILVTGGRVWDGHPSPAAAMAASLRDEFQAPVRWEEARSRNLWQSASYSAAMLQDAGISRVFLVAEPWEERLAAALFQRAGIEVTPAPVRHPDPLTIDATMFLSFAPAWLDSTVALRQWAGLACNAVAPCAAWMQRS